MTYSLMYTITLKLTHFLRPEGNVLAEGLPVFHCLDQQSIFVLLYHFEYF